MSGRFRGGFTLIELLIAFSIVAITFPVLLNLLSYGMKLYRDSAERFTNLILLDSKVKEGKLQGLEVKEEEVPDFPRVKEVIYTYKGVFLVEYRIR